MDLFHNARANLLPCDGTVIYHGPILSESAAANYYTALISTMPWQQDELMMFGKRIVTGRKVAWFGDDGRAYTYSGATKQPLPWSPELLELKALAEQRSGARFNSCLLNLYHDGSEGMGWHSDDEKEIEPLSCIASLSFGAERRFIFRHKGTKEKIEILLEQGSLLEMKGETQQHWHHALPKMAKIKTPRINLTFRKITTSHEARDSA